MGSNADVDKELKPFDRSISFLISYTTTFDMPGGDTHRPWGFATDFFSRGICAKVKKIEAAERKKRIDVGSRHNRTSAIDIKKLLNKVFKKYFATFFYID